MSIIFVQVILQKLHVLPQPTGNAGHAALNSSWRWNRPPYTVIDMHWTSLNTAGRKTTNQYKQGRSRQDIFSPAVGFLLSSLRIMRNVEASCQVGNISGIGAVGAPADADGSPVGFPQKSNFTGKQHPEGYFVWALSAILWSSGIQIFCFMDPENLNDYETLLLHRLDCSKPEVDRTDWDRCANGTANHVATEQSNQLI